MVGMGSAMTATGIENATGPYHSIEGARMLQSLGTDAPSYVEMYGLSHGLDALTLGGAKAVTTLGRKAVTQTSRISAQLKSGNLPNITKSRPNSLVQNVKESGRVEGAKSAREVIKENPLVTKKYVQEVEQITGRKVDTKQLKLLKKDLRVNEYKKLDKAHAAKHRREYDAKRDSLRAEWEKNTGEKWPVYERNYYNNEGRLIKEARAPYDGHHINPVSHGGPNEWWNLQPSHFRGEHPAIHGSGSEFKQIFNNVVKK